ncbi:hypothetical protein RhiirA5_496264 [Rhizophagus irregularis]|uniref:Uncharacterized protein n=2 Tax=Rhizophagus irregularis TaxID=588596 RepID=A0A2N0Q2E1_9GLOM|nr:hypothetical protein RirG_265250 [Rhizophagus irregularis DAOM 197198w]PKC13249.1 hypothetical protein RhiirA5_496264 [Rhizophagus irregularis]PKC70372.1 hypothetical protein RhiirA1_532757 [Rhizophagus irregularis]GET63689.1 hypothetical protein GLOIN_2v1773408 [Rhizophagus irregularis DAOM 181602=DAOM 197198]
MLVKLITDLAPSFLGDRPDHRQKLGNADFTLNSSSSLEGGYQHNIWSPIIGPVFRNLEIDLIRGRYEYISNDRKNGSDDDTNCKEDRKKIGRKRDGS